MKIKKMVLATLLFLLMVPSITTASEDLTPEEICSLPEVVEAILEELFVPREVLDYAGILRDHGLPRRHFDTDFYLYTVGELPDEVFPAFETAVISPRTRRYQAVKPVEFLYMYSSPKYIVCQAVVADSRDDRIYAQYVIDFVGNLKLGKIKMISHDN